MITTFIDDSGGEFSAVKQMGPRITAISEVISRSKSSYLTGGSYFPLAFLKLLGECIDSILAGESFSG